ncbi:MAG: Gfo/Idh/MocA family oxidoreductase [Acidobacteria bacterium]|nr:Gfo/Idh/MocA family oxidoreductase [Acidobacteriota bacterium]
MILEYSDSQGKPRRKVAGAAAAVHAKPAAGAGEIGVALAGPGVLAKWAHIPALQKIPHTRLKAIYSSSGARGKGFAPRYNCDYCTTEYDRILEDPGIHLVIVTSRNQLHASQAARAIRAGKHVLVEKPMALDGAAAEEMIAEAKRQKRVLMVAQVLRFIPAYRSLAELVKSGRLGPVRSAFFRRRCAATTWAAWLSDRSQSGGGVFDLLIHDVDFCVHLFGVPESISAVGYEDMPRGIDVILAQLHYPGIGSVTITGGWHHIGDYPFSMEFTVMGENGVVEYSSAGRPATLYEAGKKVEPLPEGEADWFQAELAYFVDCCRTGRRPELCPPEESATAVKLARIMVESRERKGGVIPCRL